jgi:hypothetical protein
MAFADNISFLSGNKGSVVVADKTSSISCKIYRNSLYFALMAFADHICFLSLNMGISSCKEFVFVVTDKTSSIYCKIYPNSLYFALIAFANQICFLSFSQYGIFFMDGICCCY